MKRIHFILWLSVLVLVSSCFSVKTFSGSQMMGVRNGMSQEEIVSLIGSPNFRRFDDDVEEWEYKGYIKNVWSTIVVTFIDGQVSGMDTFQNFVNSNNVPPSATVVVGTPQPPYHRPGNNRPGHNAPHRRDAMNKEAFDHFYSSLKNGFISERMKKIDEALLVSGFTSAQCRVLLGLFTFSSEQVELLKALYPQVVDKQNFFTAIDKLTYGTDKNVIRDYVEQYNKSR